jgi:hypothetical protein
MQPQPEQVIVMPMPAEVRRQPYVIESSDRRYYGDDLDDDDGFDDPEEFGDWFIERAMIPLLMAVASAILVAVMCWALYGAFVAVAHIREMIG